MRRAYLQRALYLYYSHIPVDDNSTRPVKIRSRTDGFKCSSRHGGETFPTSQFLDKKLSVRTKFEYFNRSGTQTHKFRICNYTR